MVKRKGQSNLKNFTKALSAMICIGGITISAYAQEVPYDYKGLTLGMNARDLLNANPEQFPIKQQSEQGLKFNVLHIVLTPQAIDQCGLFGSKDCYHVSVVLSPSETGNSVVQSIDVSQTYKSGPKLDHLAPYLFVKYGEPRIKYEVAGGKGFAGGGSRYYVWGGEGDLQHGAQGTVSLDKLTGKYVFAHISQNLFNDQVSGYRLRIVDENLQSKSAEVLRSRLNSNSLPTKDPR